MKLMANKIWIFCVKRVVAPLLVLAISTAAYAIVRISVLETKVQSNEKSIDRVETNVIWITRQLGGNPVERE
jgi:hypothetical protein